MLGTASPDTSGVMNRSGRTIAAASNSGSPEGSAGASGFAARSAASRSNSASTACRSIPGRPLQTVSTKPARALGFAMSNFSTATTSPPNFAVSVAATIATAGGTSQSSIRCHLPRRIIPAFPRIRAETASFRTGAASIAACTSAAVAPRCFHSRASLHAGRGRDDPHRCRVGEQAAAKRFRAALPGRVGVGHDHHGRGPTPPHKLHQQLDAART